MLQQLLEEIALGNTLHIKRLAVRLNTSPEMVTAMLEHLDHCGVLKKIESCNQACQSCMLTSQCNAPKSSNRLWKSEPH